jgi:hypothetical protein
LVPAGKELVISPDGSSYDLAEVNVEELVKTAQLITDFPPLPSYPLIVEEIQRQRDERIAGEMMKTQGVALRDPLSLDTVDQSFSAGAMPLSPSEFGTPNTITSPNPYVITSGTTITTDPLITTNGMTDFGKIWRGQAQDGRLSAFIFGSTSAFDTASGFDAEINGQNSMGGAIFKFTSLQLAGNPIISTPTGVINLGLIAVKGITSSGPGGILTFAGIHGLLLATQNGSITLGPEISFSGIHDINFYARGVGSNLMLGSAISGGAKISLWAQGTIQINGSESATDFRAFSGGDFLAGTGTVTATDVNIQSLSNINIDASKFPDAAGGTIDLNAANTLDIALKPGGTLTRSSLSGQGTTISLQFNSPNTFDLGNAAVSFIAGSGGIQAPNVLFANGSSLLLQATGNINIGSTQNGAGDTIRAGGAFSAQSDVSANLLQAGTSIDVGGELSALSITAGTNITAGDIVILDTTGTIGSGAAINVSAANVSTTGGFGATISNANGGNIQGNATVAISAANISSIGRGFFEAIDNQPSDSPRSGTIGGNAALGLTLSGDLMTRQDANFGIHNSGGAITGNAIINMSAASISTGLALNATIDNTGGSIGGNATINMNVAGTATAASDATFQVLGNDPSGSAAMNFNGGSYVVGNPASGGTFLGTIDGNGTITFNNASVHADVLKVGVFGSNGALNIGGGILSAGTTLKLYAPGSNGQLNFVSNVTLGGNSLKVLVANSVTIFNNIVVTIGGPNAAVVYTNNANYSGSGGNGSTTGMFAGAGATDPQPLANAPPFGVTPGAPSSTRPSSTPGARPPGRAIYIDSSTQLLTLLDSTSTGPNGRVVIDPRRTQNSRAVDSGGRNGRALLAGEQAEAPNRRLAGGVQLR